MEMGEKRKDFIVDKNQRPLSFFLSGTYSMALTNLAFHFCSHLA